MAALSRSGGYIGNEHHTLVLPAVGYEGEHAFFRGLQLGWHAWRKEGLQLDLIAQARLDGFDAGDIPLTGLQDRRASIDLGAVFALSGAAGKLAFTVLTDALDRSGGQDLALDYGYPLTAGRVRITPTIGVHWWSSDLANYYYGIRPMVAVQGAPAAYVVSSVVVPEAGVHAIVPMSRRWSLWGTLRYQHLPKEVTASPLVSKPSASTLLVGASYAF